MPPFVFSLPPDVSLHMFGSHHGLLTGPLGSLLVDCEGEITLSGRNLLCTNPRSLRVLETSIHHLQVGTRKAFDLVGTGFKADQTPCSTRVKVGYSHDTLLPHGEDWMIHIESPTTLVLYGLHPGIVGSVGAHLRDLRRPDPYKAKGVRVEGVLYTLREGKKK